MAAAPIGDRLDHILGSITKIQGYWSGSSFDNFVANEQSRAATERHLLIIAEAAKHIPDGDKAATPHIDWRAVVGLGNILRHGYDVVDDQRVWDVVQLGLPVLKVAVEATRQRY